LGEIFSYLLNWSTAIENTGKIQFEETEEVLGPDLLDNTIPMRDRLLPMLLLLVLAMETLALATLITQEASQGTARAILTTPLRLSGFFASKTIMGVGLAFVQVLILIGATGKITTAPLLLIVILLVGSLMVKGIAFIIAALARDSMSALGWGMLALIGLALPATVVIFPATNTGWADLIPSYFLVDSLHRVLNFGAGWAEISRNLLYALMTGLVALVGGGILLGRRFQ
jgi:ABC-2 type transport system permease protein